MEKKILIGFVTFISLILVLNKSCNALTPAGLTWEVDEINKTITFGTIDQYSGGWTLNITGCFDYSSDFIKTGDVITNCTGRITITVEESDKLLGWADFPGNETNCSKSQKMTMVYEERNESTPGFELILMIFAIALLLFWRQKRTI